MNKTRMVSRTR